MDEFFNFMKSFQNKSGIESFLFARQESERFHPSPPQPIATVTCNRPVFWTKIKKADIRIVIIKK